MLHLPLDWFYSHPNNCKYIYLFFSFTMNAINIDTIVIFDSPDLDYLLFVRVLNNVHWSHFVVFYTVFTKITFNA